MKVFIEADIDAETIAEQLDREQALQLIKDLDAWQEDYDFTLQLARYLVEELKKSALPEEPFKLSDLE